MPFYHIYKIFKDENSLTISEKTWISNNKNSVYTINVLNDIKNKPIKIAQIKITGKNEMIK